MPRPKTPREPGRRGPGAPKGPRGPYNPLIQALLDTATTSQALRIPCEPTTIDHMRNSLMQAVRYHGYRLRSKVEDKRRTHLIVWCEKKEAATP